MQKFSDNFSTADALRLAESPAGRQLIDLVRQADSSQLQQAAELAASGNLDQAQQLLSGLLNDPKIRQLLQQLGG